MKKSSKKSARMEKRRLKDAKFVGDMLGDQLVESLAAEEDEMADCLRVSIDDSGERVTTGKLILTKAEMKVAVEEALRYVKLALPSIINKALIVYHVEDRND